MAELGHPLRLDRLRSSWFDATAHEDHAAPDAYPIQLFGPGYEGRLPGGGEWSATELGAGRVLLEHAELEPWFDDLTIEEALRGESLPRRAVLERARASLAPILFEEITQEERNRRHAWDMEHPCVRLSEEMVAKVRALPRQPYVGHWDVALVMRDGSVIEDVELGFQGAIVSKVGGAREFELEPSEVVDVLDRGTTPSPSR